MSNLLFGSSNVYRHFGRVGQLGLFIDRNLQLIKCTKKTVLDVKLASLTTPPGLIVTSVLANFIVDVCDGVSDEEVPLFARQQITAHVEELAAVVVRNPQTNVIIVPPLFRSIPGWFGPYLTDFIGFLGSEVTRINSTRLAVCSPFIVTPSLLESDRIHLTNPGGDRFLAHLDAQLSQLLIEVAVAPAPLTQDNRLDLILETVNHTASQLNSLKSLTSSVAVLNIHHRPCLPTLRRRRTSLTCLNDSCQLLAPHLRSLQTLYSS